MQNFDLKVNKLFTKLIKKKYKKLERKKNEREVGERESGRHNGIFIRGQEVGPRGCLTRETGEVNFRSKP